MATPLDQSARKTTRAAAPPVVSIPAIISAKTSMCILGIDPGLERTGYAVIRMPGPHVLDAGFIRSAAGTPLAARLREIATGLDEVFSEHHPDRIAVEDLYSHYAHPRTAILMGHVRGVVLLAAARAGLEVVNLPATRIKKTLTGNGHASKLQMQRAIQTTMRLKQLPQPPDVADAIAIAWCAGLTNRPQNILRPSTKRLPSVLGRPRR